MKHISFGRYKLGLSLLVLAVLALFYLFSHPVDMDPPPRSCEAYLTGAGTYNDSLIILQDSLVCR